MSGQTRFTWRTEKVFDSGSPAVLALGADAWLHDGSQVRPAVLRANVTMLAEAAPLASYCV